MKSKKPIIIFSVILLLLCVILFWTFYFKVHKIKSITENTYAAELTKKGYTKLKKQSPYKVLITKYVFDTDGNLINKSYYNSDKKRVKTEAYAYNDGKILNSSENKIIKTYEYDSLGNLILIKDHNGIVAEKMEYSLEGLLILKTEVSSSEEIVSQTKYLYNEKNQIIKELIESQENIEWYLYEYNKLGNLTSESWIDNYEEPLEKTTYRYKNDDLYVEEWSNYQDGKVEGKVIYTYENDLEKEIVETDIEDGTEIRWTYKYFYDSKDNWIKKIEIFNENEVTITERLIDYY
jgi:hypothetical protein